MKEENTNDEGKEEGNERKILALMMWYLPVIHCLKRLCSSIRDAKLMIWYATTDGHKKDGKLRHLADTR
jgi:hypothetical protein